MKHPSWANYIVTSGRGIGECYLDRLTPGYRYLEVYLYKGDDDMGHISIGDRLHGGAILKNMISYEFIGEEEN